MITLSITSIVMSVIAVFSSILLFQLLAALQRKLQNIWLQPMVIVIVITIMILLHFDISFAQYYQYTWPLHTLLEAAVVALGFPLYQHLDTILRQWKIISFSLILGAIFAISVSFIITILLVADHSLAVALALKSVTTPIAIALAQQLDGNTAITAFAIVLAGFFGALLGPKWLNLIGIEQPKAQGLAIGAASHAIGTAMISNISYQHAAYGSLALISSAVITAIISPILIPMLATLL